MESHPSPTLFSHLPESFPNFQNHQGCCWMQAPPQPPQAPPSSVDGPQHPTRRQGRQNPQVLSLLMKQTSNAPEEGVGHSWWKHQRQVCLWVCFSRPFTGTKNEVIATNICIEEFGICEMLNLLLDVFSFPERAAGTPICVSSWRGDFSSSRANWALSPRLQHEILNFIGTFLNALGFNTKGTK